VDEIKVSVCMTTYNHERYIAQAVESVLAQQVDFPIELVVGEDLSTDRTREIVQDLAQKHPDRIRLRLSDRNLGGQANFLATIALCRGQYVAMLEGDDYWTCADKLQRQVEALDSHPEWAICFHPCACLYEDGMQGIPVYPLGWAKPVATMEDLFSSNFLPTSSVVFRNRLFPTFPEWFRDLAIGDWALHILNAEHGDIGFMPDVMSAYRVHRGGVWSGATHAERTIFVFELFSAIDHHFEGKYTQSINAYRAATIRWVISQLDAVTSRLNEADEQIGSAQAQRDEQTLGSAHTQAQAEAQAKAYARAQERESIRTTRLETQLKVLQNERLLLLNDHAQLQGRYAVLEENARSLLEFYKTWTKSPFYRVEREIRRPIRRLSRYLRNRFQGKREANPPQKPPVSKAA
jgi:glycosyltransferase involved in cell wall biosynthesis